MLTQLEKMRERWGGTHALIDRWLEERRELIVLFCEASGIQPSTQKTQSAEHTQKFCQVLLDYISAGHFEIYQQLLEEEQEFGGRALHVMRDIYPQLTATTDKAITFNDKYDTSEHCEQLKADLARDLSTLGEALALRFELEDQLIETLHNAHRAQLQAAS